MNKIIVNSQVYYLDDKELKRLESFREYTENKLIRNIRNTNHY